MTPEEIKRVFGKAREALAIGKITQEEHDRLLKHYYGTTDEQEALGTREPIATQGTPPGHGVAVALIIALLMLMPFLWLGDGITGLITMDSTVTSVIVSGTMYGDGNATIWFDTANGSLLVGTVQSDTGLPMTQKAGYSIGEEVNIINAPEDASYYFDEGTAAVTVDIPFNATVNGTLLIVTPNSTYRLPIIIGDAVRATEFSNICVETCALEPTVGTIRIEENGTNTTIIEVEAGLPNNPPTRTAELNISISAPTTLDLDNYFADPDQDPLFYNIGASSIADLAVQGSMLTITPLLSGTEQVIIYVSDLEDLVPAMLQLTVEVQNTTGEGQETMLNETVPLNETDSTMPDSSVITNVTTNTTTTNVTTNVTTPPDVTMLTTDCADPDPNKRPLECIQDENSTYFREEEIYIENKDGAIVGKITPIGNMLIRGEAIENSVGMPASRDWTRGYEDNSGDFIPTLWIDSQTGDLHLRGTLTEANRNIVFSPGLTALLNERDIILALIDAQTGNLIVRGSVIPYRRSFG
jgi:hypothetical protein